FLPDLGHLCVFCGRGNNGGDGFVVARLAHAQGYGVDCLVAGEEADLSPQASEQMQTAKAAGVEPIYRSDARWMPRADCVGCRDLIVDGLLGTGVKGEVQGPILEAIQSINRSGVPVIAVDVPSGIECDTGEELGESVWALSTVTFGLPKPFLFQGIGLEHAGHWTVAEIGYPNALLNEPADAQLVEEEWVSSLLPERLRASHKGENGSILIVAGSERMPGAATLAVRGALRGGAGLVTIASIPSVCRAVAGHVPEALLMPLPERDGAIAPEASAVLLEHQGRYHSALFGPGLTHEPSVKGFLEAVWAGWTRPCAIDADALNALSEGLELPKADCVLTPHPGEMGRLLHSCLMEI
ncbi:MAG: NAD(P)H-hydrate epimerase, partial [Fimbriimonas ginsengisoli]|nr:NAD(P)H-hydrate epimerase [Fimbriimonas ginsengisoli]